MQELNDEEMQNVDGGGYGKVVQLDMSQFRTCNYFYPDASLVKQTDGSYIYDKTKALKINMLDIRPWPLKIQFGIKVVPLKVGAKLFSIVHCKIAGVGEGYINKVVADRAIMQEMEPSKGTSSAAAK